jgi:hypothetical protein
VGNAVPQEGQNWASSGNCSFLALEWSGERPIVPLGDLPGALQSEEENDEAEDSACTGSKIQEGSE